MAWILICSNDKTFCEALKTTLTQAGHQAFLENGDHHFPPNAPGVIISDYNGLSDTAVFIQNVRDEYPGYPKLYLTPFSMLQSILVANESTLEKPISPNGLLTSIEKLLGTG